MRWKAIAGEASKSVAPISTPSRSIIPDCLKKLKDCSSSEQASKARLEKSGQTEEDRTAMKSELSALPSVLKGSLREYRIIEGADLLTRVDSFYKWQDARR